MILGIGLRSRGRAIGGISAGGSRGFLFKATTCMPQNLANLSSPLILHILLWKAVFSPNEAMVVSRASALPLITIPVILDLKFRRNNLLHQNSEPSMEMVGGNMGVIADILSGNLDPLSSSRLRFDGSFAIATGALSRRSTWRRSLRRMKWYNIHGGK
jgi:hypothetical protein